MANTNVRISNIISSQVPSFVRNDHETFVAFMEAYYEYLEQYQSTLSEGKVVERTKNLLTYIDIDQTLEDFVDKYYTEFLNLLNADIIADKTLILKHAKDFYRAKGTEKSLKFLIRILTDKESTIYYPKKDILKASDGKWFIQKSFRISNTHVENVYTDDLTDFQNFINRQITGNTTNSHAIVERVDRFYEGGSRIDELILTSISGTFELGERIHATYFDANDNLKNITSDIVGGIVTNIIITNVGYSYNVGDYLLFTANTGSGANAVISAVTTGNITSISPLLAGAGFKANDNFLITGGGGSGANAYISNVNTDGTVHPNTYNIIIDLISYEANTTIGNTVYSNLSLSNANITLENALSSFVYGPTGPIEEITLRTAGSGYSSLPTFDAIANTRIKELGILGSMTINDGGENYEIGDLISFTSVDGFGANAQVSNVDANGTITEVNFTANTGFVIGGFNYKQSALPSLSVNSANGANANIVATAILGDGESVSLSVANIGSIASITILSGGSGYANAPTINLQQSGSGTARATATVIQGIYTYPGRYLNDDGHLDGLNFLQNEHYYQNFSYVIKVKESLATYKKLVKDVLHPAGMKLFGEYTFVDSAPEIESSSNTAKTILFKSGTYVYDNVINTVTVTRTTHGLSASANVYLEFISGDTDNVSNGVFVINGVPDSNTFNVIITSGEANTSGNVNFGTFSI